MFIYDDDLSEAVFNETSITSLMAMDGFSQTNIENTKPTVATTIPLASGYGKLGYDLPAVGSYQLTPISQAADGNVLDERGSVQSLHQLFKGKYALLSFMYSNCSDVNGCPAEHVLQVLKEEIKKLK